MVRTLALSLLAIPAVFAAQAPTFVPASPGPLIPSDNLGGPSNGSLPKQPVVSGKQFDRFIQIWLENTDFDTANSSQTFRNLAKQGILLTSSYALTHPSEPNYVASVGGDFFGMGDDEYYNIPSNISTIVDLLEMKNISWASYQESMPSDGYEAFNFTQRDYHSGTKNSNYTYYVRKHNPLIVFDSVAGDPNRRALQRTFNDFAADVNASAIPQWVFITPNLVNDAHDTDVDWASGWLENWLVPLLSNNAFNDPKTLILLTFDENDTFEINNRIFSVLLGGAVPDNLKGSTDPTYYTHYSSLSTVQLNWGLGCLGRHDTDPQMSNVYKFVADAVGYTGNNQLKNNGNDIPLTNITETIPGALNPEFYQPFAAQNTNAKCIGGGNVFVAQGVNTSLTAATLPPPVNLTSLNQNLPASGPRTGSDSSSAPSPSATSPGSGSGSGSGSGGSGNTSGAINMMANLVSSLVIAGIASYFTF